MRKAKIVFGLVLFGICAGVTFACYRVSHGAGVGTGILLGIVIMSFLYDHGRHIFRGTPASATKQSVAVKAAMMQGQLSAIRHP
ncbi:MAG: hypothetical protein ACOH12_13275 [Parvibaculaceae bacterium]